MFNHKIVLSYDGTSYHGFQVQKNALGVQEVIEKSLEKLYGLKIKIEGASRTDAGVHARGQVINFIAPGIIPIDRLPIALNGVLPPDIVVYKAEKVNESFSARKSACAKKYTYIIDNGFFPDVFLRNYTWHIPSFLDLAVVKRAAAVLLGKHDFRAFQSTGSSVNTTVRTLFRLDIKESGRLIYINFEGDGFLYKMVRNITGTLVEIGLRKKKSEEIEDILRSKERSRAGKTAPPAGLCLEEVIYRV